MTRPGNPWAKAFADFTQIYHQITKPEAPAMQSTISTLTAQLVADLSAFNTRARTDRTMTEAEAEAGCDALNQRELDILAMPSQTDSRIFPLVTVNSRIKSACGNLRESHRVNF